MRGQGATGAHLDEPDEPKEPDESQAHEDTGLLHPPQVFLFLHPQEGFGILHELQTGESSKPSLEPPTRTSIPSLFLKPTRVKAKPATPAPPRIKATIPTSIICVQVKFITPSNITK